MPAVPGLNGPNLDLRGRRGPEIDGHTRLAGIEATRAAEAKRLGVGAAGRQSNREGQLVSWVQEVPGRLTGSILDAGAYHHSSIASLAAWRALDEPLIEVHLSNIYRREIFRQHSHVSFAANGVLCGCGPRGDLMALHAIAAMLADATSD